MSLSDLNADLRKLSNPEKAKILQRFFKTGRGEYAEGDIFLGIAVPEQRKLVKKFSHLSLEDIEHLISSKYHEERLTALLLLVKKFERHPELRKQIFNFYLLNTKNINNWDLVDLSAPNIVGKYLIDKDKSILYKLAKSNNLWEKRISILATFAFIRDNEFKDSMAIAELLLKDRHDLIHKAVGWMLREIGKKDVKVLENFLKQHCKQMPRTMLRYSIEKFPEEKRKAYLKGEIE